MKKLGILLIVVIISSLLVSGSDSVILKISTSEKNIDNVIKNINKESYMLYFELGKDHFQSQNYDKSIEMFKKTIFLNEDFAEAYHNLAIAYYKNNQIDNAILFLKDAANLRSDYDKAFYSLALIYYEEKDYVESIDNLKKVIKIQPSNANAYFDLGVIYVEKFRSGTNEISDLANAIYYYQKADEIDPGFPHALDNINIIKRIMATI